MSGGLARYLAQVLGASRRLEAAERVNAEILGLERSRTRPVTPELAQHILDLAPSAKDVYAPTGTARAISGATSPDQDTLTGALERIRANSRSTMFPEEEDAIYKVLGTMPMTPRQFRESALPLLNTVRDAERISDLARSIEKSGLKSPPMFYLDRTGPRDIAQSHDGRHRMRALAEVLGTEDAPLPTLLMGGPDMSLDLWRNPAMRLSPEYIDAQQHYYRIPDALRFEQTYARGGRV